MIKAVRRRERPRLDQARRERLAPGALRLVLCLAASFSTNRNASMGGMFAAFLTGFLVLTNTVRAVSRAAPMKMTGEGVTLTAMF